ncbi:MAG: sarcosine oxidase subunit gamma family protein [Alsobacter sp.]
MSDATMTAPRRSPLENRSGEAAIDGVSLTACPPRTRLILRGEASTGAAGAVLGLEIPRKPNRAAAAGERAALWLGPDEWLILAPEAETATLFASLEQALASVPHALVDVSHRQTAILLSGPGCADALNAAVPLDLSEAAFPVGMATRTIFEKAEIVLWRTGPESFHLEVWRSFSPYVWTLLDAVRRENAAL